MNKYKCIVEYEYPVDHKLPVKAEIVLHGDRVVTDRITPYKEPKQGEWIVVVPNVSSKCPFCSTIVSDTPNFCPNCGARMKEGDEK